MTEQHKLSDQDLHWMALGLEAPDCTLTDYWASRVRLLIAEVKQLRADSAYLANAVELLQRSPR